ncbi:MAG: hypothetical protein Q8922_00865 [Bacteroidota bacterium]|nr:hypothetical protein [Bacteroidota bacterium]MDP4232584.1 hypothetical protein [Bacteroidota bacterium]MDP4242962.1 hypothetical protein [Bacteroidota bacterium]MDP4286463.1 hypothetical protein [Bacteroidota bacterium]
MNAQSWFDLATMDTLDPRSLISTATLQDNTGATQTATFLRSINWLQAVTWGRAADEGESARSRDDIFPHRDERAGLRICRIR